MKTISKLMIAGLAATQLLAVAPTFAKGHAVPVTHLESVVVVGKKSNLDPVTQLESVVVIAHRAPSLAEQSYAPMTTRVVYHPGRN